VIGGCMHVQHIHVWQSFFVLLAENVCSHQTHKAAEPPQQLFDPR
jgi:hypothetical protein